MKLVPLALALPLLFSPTPLWADDPPKEEPKEEPKEAPEEPKEEPEAEPAEIAWVHDYDEAKKKAAEAKKGLFVYMTPSWFT